MVLPKVSLNEIKTKTQQAEGSSDWPTSRAVYFSGTCMPMLAYSVFPYTCVRYFIRCCCSLLGSSVLRSCAVQLLWQDGRWLECENFCNGFTFRRCRQRGNFSRRECCQSIFIAQFNDFMQAHYYPHSHFTSLFYILMLSAIQKAYRMMPHRRHGSASEEQVASVANKQIYLFWLSESLQFPINILIDPDTVLLSRLFQLLTCSEKKWCLKLVDALFFISFSEWPLDVP